MNTTGLAKYAGAVAALAICSACGGALRQAQDDMAVAPSNAALNGGMLVTAARPNLSAMSRYTPILPDRSAKSKGTFEYIIDDYGTYAGIFDYPKSDKEIGSIHNVGGQGCTNVLYGYGKKTFWIVAGADQITKYEVPKTPLKTLFVPYGQPSSCAMNTSGDLAVGNLTNGDVIIFKNASGSGEVMTTPLSYEFFDGYDNNGNLFADGFNPSGDFELVELPKGSSTFEAITTSNTVEFPGSVQWDGKYLVVTDQLTDAMYQYTVSGTQATLQGTVSLSGPSDCAQTWIATGVVYCADAGLDNGSVYKYPAGGSSIAVFTGRFDLPLGTVAAEK